MKQHRRNQRKGTIGLTSGWGFDKVISGERKFLKEIGVLCISMQNKFKRQGRK